MKLFQLTKQMGLKKETVNANDFC
uniref:Uncharacterized protein n=1 Tax=Rhizophora mucronata TaxID=61149 RepID=A0A2P2PY81_RHIMU